MITLPIFHVQGTLKNLRLARYAIKAPEKLAIKPRYGEQIDNSN
jgi:hypothetical protein